MVQTRLARKQGLLGSTFDSSSTTSPCTMASICCKCRSLWQFAGWLRVVQERALIDATRLQRETPLGGCTPPNLPDSFRRALI